MKNLTMILAIFALMGMAAAQGNGGDPTIFHKHSDIPVTAAGWTTAGTQTVDCTAGWGVDRWILTLTEAKDVTVRVADCCITGDYYGIYVDGNLVGTTPTPSCWGTGCGDAPSDGSATVSLMPGTYTITVRDVAFDAHQPPGYMCPAGFTVYGSTAPYTGTTVPEAGFAVAAIALLTPGMMYLARKRN